MIDDVVAAIRQTFSPSFRTILWKSLLATLLALVAAWVALERLAFWLLGSVPAWVAAGFGLLSSAGFVFCAAYLIAPISALVVGFYLDDLAELVEKDLGPEKIGRAVPVGQALWTGGRFAALALVVNMVALALLLVPVVNLVAFLGANAYLIGRASFELAAMRRLPLRDALAIYKRNAAYVSLAGVWIAILLAIPILNLATPLFAMALMARILDRVRLQEEAAGAF